MVRPMIRFSSLALIVALPLLVSGCSDARRAMGYEKSVPDEFQVVEQAPLSMPPDFTLRPPSPGSARPQDGSTRDQARAAVTGMRGRYAPIDTTGKTAGEVALLQRVGAEKTQPNVRTLVNKESQALAEADQTFTDKLVFWRDPLPAGYKEQLDPVAESKRLRENQALGQPVTKGENPIIKRGNRGMLEGIF